MGDPARTRKFHVRIACDGPHTHKRRLRAGAYRLIKFAGARRVLFLVDRANLGRQTLKEFQAFTTPDDGRKFTALYNVQHLSSNVIDPVARVTITTIQRLYSILKGDTELDPELDEHSTYDLLPAEPVPVAYNPWGADRGVRFRDRR